MEEWAMDTDALGSQTSTFVNDSARVYSSFPSFQLLLAFLDTAERLLCMM